MVTLDDLLEEQAETFDLLEKFIENHHKTAQNKITVGYMQARLKLLGDYYQQFKSVHSSIRRGSNADQREKMDYFKSNKLDKFIELHLDIQIELNDVLNKLQAPPPEDPNRHHNNQPPPQGYGLKLPKVHIPQFAGSYQNWTNFYDVFLSLVHNHPTLSKVEKLHHLKSALSGEAEQLLKHFTITDVNYEPAWELLTKRYKNNRLIINAHLKTLTSTPKLTQESAPALRNLLDTTTEALLSLKNLEVPTDQWDAIIVFLIEQKMDPESLKSWEQSRTDPGKTPSFEELTKFLETRFRALEMVSNTSQPAKYQQQRNVKTFLTSSESCKVCAGTHRIYECTKFLNMDRGLRRRFIDNNSICSNCLSHNHKIDTCKSRFSCRFCRKRHHSMLHDKGQSSQSTPAVSQNHDKKNISTTPETTKSVTLHNVNSEANSSNVLLATAMVQIDSPDGTHTFRALVDPCSQASFISEEAARQLRLPTKALLTSVNGVGAQLSQRSTSTVEFVIKSCHGLPRSHPVTALVLPSITQCLPHRMFHPNTWTHLQHLPLADPTFAQPGKIDLLLGAKIFKRIILPGLQKGSPDELIAQQTTLGWIITGDDSSCSKTDITQFRSSVRAFHSCIDIDSNLQRFWELETVPVSVKKTDEEQRCEKFYDKTHLRSSNGRYTVKLPFNTYQGKDDPQEAESGCTVLGRSRYAALNRLYQIEKRFIRDPELGKQYSEVMSNYLSLGHMEPVEDSEEDFRHNTSGTYASYYLPHHAVVKESSSTTKVRVVFDASMKTSQGSSLNENLLVGPTIQQDLMSIVLRWRKHKIAFTADIEQMYRQIQMDSKDSNYQRILWRESSTQLVKEYRLRTVTFGVSSAPYLAIRTLHQLASDESQKFPKASDVTLNDFYVDDLMSGCDTIDEAKEIQTQLIEMLKAGGFALKKWSSNSTEVVRNVPEDYRESKFLLNIDTDDSIKSLGLHWQPASDIFSFKVNITPTTEIPTKRKLLSDVSKLFDPLGWLAPTVIVAKIMFQSLWLLGLTWDEPLPPDIATKWIKYRNDLAALETIQIPRYIGYTKQTSVQLHGFSDASLGAYSAVVYFRVLYEDGRVNVKIVASKTRVSPVKTISVPRLELCGAVLLARLLKAVTQSLLLGDVQIIAWTDSTVVLAWLHKPPSQWKVFVANRTSEVLETMNSSQWRHVSSTDNPADCASRGVSPTDLKNHPLWWTGPKWLLDSPDKWPSRTEASAFSTDIDQRKTSELLCLTNTVSSSLWNDLSEFSTKRKIVRVLGYCLRFIRNIQEKDKSKRLYHHYLQPAELQTSLQTVLLLVQSSAFHDDIKRLQNKMELGRQSKLLSLNPFLDESGMLRVGGRIQKSNLAFDIKHPIILPSNHEFTKMAIQEAHLHTLHGGTQLTLSYLRRKFWILNARNTTRFTIHECIRCHRFSAKTQEQIMGNLPAPRVTPSRPFCHAGVDYAGPINVRVSKGRGTKTYKGYMAIFVCLSTKAIHIELVSDMTTEAFIAAFRRFTSRRGLCTDMYSDCGTNFVGAGTKLSSDFEKSINEATREVGELLATNGTQWHYIPPASPHFGGLWEAGVKSTKHHLKRVIGESTLTFEELYTVLTQIEACLNSRPLCPMTSDPTDLSVLTPGHFLVGDALVIPPEPSYLDKNGNSLTRWRLVQKMVHDFWNIWSTEYLSRLQQRPKWVNKHRNIKINELVLIKDNRLPPSKWLLGRITAVHPGKDAQVRVVSVQCGGSIIKRPITKISPLPINTSEDTTVMESNV